MAKHMGEGRGHASHHDHPEHHMHTDVHGRHHENHEEHGAHHDGREKHGRGAHHEEARGAPHESRTNRGGHEPRGGDAATMRPRLIPDYELLPRDDSGGFEWQPYTAEWGDGGYVTGEKAHLSVRGGRDDEEDGDEIESRGESRDRIGGTAGGPASSRRMSKE